MRKKHKEIFKEVRTLRPEERYGDPLLYYTPEVVEKYASSSRERKVQSDLAKRIVEILGISPPAKILDIGCGAGFSGETLKNMGFEVVGIDVVPEMVKEASKRIRAVVCDARHMEKVLKEKFGGAMSVSAIQWFTKDPQSLRSFAKGLFEVLKPGAKAGLQFYPKSEAELRGLLKALRRAGFNAHALIENPDNPKRRTVIVVAEKPAV